jgi:hypothetical protein
MTRKSNKLSVRMGSDMAAALRSISLGEGRSKSDTLRLVALDGLEKRGFKFDGERLVSVPEKIRRNHA